MMPFNPSPISSPSSHRRPPSRRGLNDLQRKLDRALDANADAFPGLPPLYYQNHDHDHKHERDGDHGNSNGNDAGADAATDDAGNAKQLKRPSENPILSSTMSMSTISRLSPLKRNNVKKAPIAIVTPEKQKQKQAQKQAQTQKDGSPLFTLNSNSDCFVPIDCPPLSGSGKTASVVNLMTPPASPYDYDVGNNNNNNNNKNNNNSKKKQQKHQGQARPIDVSSPAPSLLSVALTEDMTERSLTPSYSPGPYLQMASHNIDHSNVSPYHHHHRHHHRHPQSTPPHSRYRYSYDSRLGPVSPSPSPVKQQQQQQLQQLQHHHYYSSQPQPQLQPPFSPTTAGGNSGGGSSSNYYYGGFSAPSSPRKSPNKNYYRRPSAASSPYGERGRGGAGSAPSLVPYSPGASSSSIGSTTSTEDAASRRQRAKTEMCMHYSNGRVCPFGINCTYAHGEAELQMTKLMDLHRSGLIEDVETYRTKPCFTQIATGSCPFGKRCACVHDPRIEGSISSWLPHTETQGNSMSTDINVDGLHQKRLNTILHANPFGDQFSLELDEFADLYKLICNTSHGSNNKRRRNHNISEAHKLAIALNMRGGHRWMFKYRPQHVVYGELCMILQSQPFRLEKSGNATPITMALYKSRPNHSQHVLVREMAFGPDSDPAVRGVALWFHIPEQEVAECSPQQAKRYRWKKSPKKVLEDNCRSSIFDSKEHFYMIRPIDKGAFDLATDILHHRHEMVQAEKLSTLSERFDTIKALKAKKEELQDRFQQHKHHWIAWAWPINTGRQSIDDDTPVPAIDGKYIPLVDPDATTTATWGSPRGTPGHCGDNDSDVAVQGSAIQPVWETFVTNDFDSIPVDHAATPVLHNRKQLIRTVGASSPASSQQPARRPLSIFIKLARGESVCPNRNLPHITKYQEKLKAPISKGATASNKMSMSCKDKVDDQSERCWMALLSTSQECKQRVVTNEWEIVREHFKNARCKKVLNILQQKGGS